MNKKICRTVVENRKRLVPALFTAQQVDLLKKYLKGQSLNRTEQAYLYSTIKKKTDALLAFKEEWHITGLELISERVEEAKKILRELGKEKAFISGSFLYAEKYNDVDVFIVGKRRKEETKGKKNFVYINEQDLQKLVFISMMKCCVANFQPVITTKKRWKPMWNDLIMTYELAISEVLDDDDQKTVREILFAYYYQAKKRILDSQTLYQKHASFKKMPKQERIKMVNDMIKQLINIIYSPKYIYNAVTSFKKQIDDAIEEYPKHDNLRIYANLLKEVKNECRATEI
ncbi:hypothetical protein HYU19_04445 [Candidatus Woesearchaeota archaeon]|nr:hypothetical protein [Candidatus Woesearchaeota archaeon]